MAFFAVVSLVFGIIGFIASIFRESLDGTLVIYGLLASYLAAPSFLVASFFTWANAKRPDRVIAHRVIAGLLVLAFVSLFIMFLDFAFTPASVGDVDPRLGSPLGFAPFVAFALTWAAGTVTWFLVFGKRMPAVFRAIVAFVCATASTLALALMTSSPITVPLAAGAALAIALRDRFGKPRR